MNNQRLEILHVITGLNEGGAEGVLYRLCSHDDKNHHTVVSMMNEGKYGSLLTKAGVNIYCLNMKQGRISLRGLIRLFRLIHQLKPDVVQTWMYHADLIGGIAAKLNGIKSICWGIRHSNITPGKIKRSTLFIARLCAKLSGFVPTKIISCSEQGLKTHQEIGYSKSKFEIIPNGYNLDLYSPNQQDRNDLRVEWGIPENLPLLGMVARFDIQKDHANLFAALEYIIDKNIDFRCVLIGTGMETHNPNVANLFSSEKFKNKIMLLGRRSDVPRVMNALDIHVLSSLGEAFPNVLAEAMACEVPCVSTDVGDAALIVGNTGWIVPPSSPVELGSAIEIALNEIKDGASWKQRKMSARKRITENFSIQKMVLSYQKTWLETYKNE